MMPSTARAVTTALQSIGSLDIMLLPPGLCSSPTRCLSLGTPRLRHALARQPHAASACLQALESNSRRRRSSPRSHARSQTCRRASGHPWDAPPRVARAARTMARARVERQRAGDPGGRRAPARRRITAASHRPRGASGDAHLQGGCDAHAARGCTGRCAQNSSEHRGVVSCRDAVIRPAQSRTLPAFRCPAPPGLPRARPRGRLSDPPRSVWGACDVQDGPL
jgi:hypothetical protein